MNLPSRRSALALMSASALSPLVGCATPTGEAAAAGGGDDAFNTLAGQSLDSWARLNPISATQLGDHRFDGEIDDAGATGRAARNAYRDDVLAKLGRIDRSTLSPAAQVDASMLANQMRFELWYERDSESWAWDPLGYNSAVGGALYTLMAREFAPLPERLNNAAARMEKLPGLLAQARAELVPERVPKVHADTLARQNPGVLSIIDDMILSQRETLGPSDKARLEAAAARLKDEVNAHQRWIEETLVPAAKGDFRLGARLYDSKLALAFNTPMSRADIKREAEAALERVRSEMIELASQIVTPPANERWTPQRLIAQALERAAADRPTRANVVEACERTLADATAFVRAHDLITLPDAPVNVIMMPEFQRGVAVAYCDSPGPLDRGQSTFYAVSPIPDEWSDEQATSFLREYNNRSIHELTVHEAMPGHYVQLWHSNKYPSLTRAAFYSGAFVEGWACYAQDVMVEAGFEGDDPLAKLVNRKWALRVIVNALLDQAIHVDGMSQEDAMRMMTETAFQEEREAAGKWIRASVSSTQLSTYFIGWTEHWATRREAERRWGADFKIKDYHDRLLSFGSPAGRHARALLFGEPIDG